MCIFLPCLALGEGLPLPLLTGLFRIQLSLLSYFKLLKTNEKSEVVPNWQVLSEGEYLMLSRSPKKPQANQV